MLCDIPGLPSWDAHHTLPVVKTQKCLQIAKYPLGGVGVVVVNVPRQEHRLTGGRSWTKGSFLIRGFPPRFKRKRQGNNVSKQRAISLFFFFHSCDFKSVSLTLICSGSVHTVWLRVGWLCFQFPETSTVYSWYHGIIINNASFYSQMYPCLDNKLYGPLSLCRYLVILDSGNSVGIIQSLTFYHLGKHRGRK